MMLNIFNHPSTKGIEDYIHYIRYTLQSQNLRVDISNMAPRYGNRWDTESNDMNIVIEFDERNNVYRQFTDGTELGIIATEFISDGGFNQFLMEDKKLDAYLNKMKAEKLMKFLDTARSGREKLKALGGKGLLIAKIVKLISILMIDKGLTVKLIKAYITGKSLDEFGYRLSLNLRYRNFINNLNKFSYNSGIKGVA